MEGGAPRCSGCGVETRLWCHSGGCVVCHLAAQDEDGATPLMLAAYKVRGDTKGPLQVFSPRTTSPLGLDVHPLLTQGHANKVELLVSAGADVTLRDKRGRTALHWAAEGLSNAETVSALLASKDAAKLVGIKDADGVRAATRARVRGETKLAKLMEKA